MTDMIPRSRCVLTGKKDIPRANVILRAGTCNDEIKRDIQENINPAVVFWE